MKYIFTLLLSFPILACGQFNEMINRIHTHRPVEITIGKVFCGFGRGNEGSGFYPVQQNWPPVRRSLEGLSLAIPRFRFMDTFVSPAKTEPCRGIFRCQGTAMENDPLLVVDAVPKDSITDFKNIPVEAIESINILKDVAARGLQWVSTTVSAMRTLIICDAENESPVPGATLRFVSADGKDSLQFAANDSGILMTDRLKRGQTYAVTVTAAGYQSQTGTFKNSYWQSPPMPWRMQRNILCQEEVVIVSRYEWRNRKLYCVCKGRIVCKHQVSVPAASGRRAVCYPNPARAGQTITLKLERETEEPLALLIWNGSGQRVRSENFKSIIGINQFRFTMDPGIAAGTYFYQLWEGKGQLLTSGKLIIR